MRASTHIVRYMAICQVDELLRHLERQEVALDLPRTALAWFLLSVGLEGERPNPQAMAWQFIEWDGGLISGLLPKGCGLFTLDDSNYREYRKIHRAQALQNRPGVAAA